jgi:hypothetical protein
MKNYYVQMKKLKLHVWTSGILWIMCYEHCVECGNTLRLDHRHMWMTTTSVWMISIMVVVLPTVLNKCPISLIQVEEQDKIKSLTLMRLSCVFVYRNPFPTLGLARCIKIAFLAAAFVVVVSLPTLEFHYEILLVALTVIADVPADYVPDNGAAR